MRTTREEPGSGATIDEVFLSRVRQDHTQVLNFVWVVLISLQYDVDLTFDMPGLLASRAS